MRDWQLIGMVTRGRFGIWNGCRDTAQPSWAISSTDHAASIGWARVRVGAESRTSAEKLRANLRAAGASREVQRN